MAIGKFSLKAGFSVKLKSNNIFRKKKNQWKCHKKWNVWQAQQSFQPWKKGLGVLFLTFRFMISAGWVMQNQEGDFPFYRRWRPQDQKDEFYPKPCLQSQTHLGKEGPLAVSGPSSCSSFQGPASKIKSVCSGHFLVELWGSLRMGTPTPCPTHTNSSFQPSGSVPQWKMS